MEWRLGQILYMLMGRTGLNGEYLQVQICFTFQSQGMCWGFLFACLFINVIYFVTAQWLSFQAVLSYFLSVLGAVLPKKVKSIFMTSSRAQGPVVTILRLTVQRWGRELLTGSIPSANSEGTGSCSCGILPCQWV